MLSEVTRPKRRSRTASEGVYTKQLPFRRCDSPAKILEARRIDHSPQPRNPGSHVISPNLSADSVLGRERVLDVEPQWSPERGPPRKKELPELPKPPEVPFEVQSEQLLAEFKLRSRSRSPSVKSGSAREEVKPILLKQTQFDVSGVGKDSEAKESLPISVGARRAIPPLPRSGLASNGQVTEAKSTPESPQAGSPHSGHEQQHLQHSPREVARPSWLTSRHDEQSPRMPLRNLRASSETESVSPREVRKPSLSPRAGSSGYASPKDLPPSPRNPTRNIQDSTSESPAQTSPRETPPSPSPNIIRDQDTQKDQRTRFVSRGKATNTSASEAESPRTPTGDSLSPRSEAGLVYNGLPSSPRQTLLQQQKQLHEEGLLGRSRTVSREANVSESPNDSPQGLFRSSSLSFADRELLGSESLSSRHRSLSLNTTSSSGVRDERRARSISRESADRPTSGSSSSPWPESEESPRYDSIVSPGRGATLREIREKRAGRSFNIEPLFRRSDESGKELPLDDNSGDNKTPRIESQPPSPRLLDSPRKYAIMMSREASRERSKSPRSSETESERESPRSAVLSVQDAQHRRPRTISREGSLHETRSLDSPRDREATSSARPRKFSFRSDMSPRASTEAKEASEESNIPFRPPRSILSLRKNKSERDSSTTTPTGMQKNHVVLTFPSESPRASTLEDLPVNHAARPVSKFNLLRKAFTFSAKSKLDDSSEEYEYSEEESTKVISEIVKELDEIKKKLVEYAAALKKSPPIGSTSPFSSNLILVSSGTTESTVTPSPNSRNMKPGAGAIRSCAKILISF